nr:OCIA domain-containing protein 1-like isoform X1 [Procambarus clarkii]
MSTDPPPHHGHPVHHTPRPSFNQEELRVLRECNRESFYYRSVPIAAGLSAATYLAMRQGILKMSSRFGYTPKIIGASFIGYFMGKLSYQGACAEKMMQLPNSPIGEALRKRMGRVGFQETLGMEPGFMLGYPSSELGPPTSDEPIFDDHRPDLRDHNEGLDDYERGVTESLTPYTEASSSASQQYTTYQELRRQNREEHINKMAEKYRRPQTADTLPESGPLPQGAEDYHPIQPTHKLQPSIRTTGKKNQYGDDVDE